MNLFRQKKLRGKLLTILIVSLFLGLMVVGFALYFQFKSFLYSRIQDVLTHYILLTENTLDMQQLQERNFGYLKHFVDDTADEIGTRVSIMDLDGVVLVDSEIAMEDIKSVENHINRPEIQEARNQKIGFDIRRSATIDQDLLYTSIMINGQEQPLGYLRLAMFATQTDQMLSTARWYFVSGGLLIFLVSALLVIILSRRINRNLNEVIRKARKIAGGALDTRIEMDSSDELQELGSSLNKMAGKLSGYLDDLSQERQDLGTVLSSIHEGIIAIDADKRIIFFNDKTLQFLNTTRDKINQKQYQEVFTNEHLLLLLDNFFERPLFINDEIWLNKYKILDITITPFDIKSQKQGGCVVVFRDVSQFKKLEKIRRDFVANVSHEFKTPLAAIRGYAETMLDWGLEDATVSRKYTSKIVKQSHQLENLVQDLLQLARIERLQSIELTEFNPHNVLKDLYLEYGEKAEEKQQTLTLNVKGDNYNIIGEPEMFRSILGNLIDNAVKYTQSGGTIEINAAAEDQYVVFSVKDNGFGIPEKYQERIFERFYRVDKARSRSIGGTGLGLSIVKHLAEIQNSEIRLESIENEGSCFSVRFKIAR